MPPPTLHTRSSGLLLHPTSLPGPHGSGDLGPEARTFLRFLVEAGQRWWLVLPVGPAGFGNSPYSAPSAFAGSPLLVALDTDARACFPNERADWPAVAGWRAARLRDAFASWRPTANDRADHARFMAEAAPWLDDWALFAALKAVHGELTWTCWPAALRDRQPSALAEARRAHADAIAFHAWVQWRFDRQWAALRRDAADLGIGLVGDLPIFVAHDSADVWSHRDLFLLDDLGAPTVVAGVPPDYFSATGQRWGNPLYDWPAHARAGFTWWRARLAHALRRFDAVRLDHFIGFHRYWEIPASEPTAVHGVWCPGPGPALFDALRDALGDLPLIAEDLGAVTPEVHALRARYDLPGLRVLQFAFGEDPSAPAFKPHNYPRRTVAFTGTHDNDTAQGWYADPGGPTRNPAKSEAERRHCRAYLNSDGRAIHWDMIRAVQASVADLAMVPLQDVLGLGSEARMNRPGQAEGNWTWRLPPDALRPDHAERLAEMARLYDRSPP